jgi:hypothetical protein
MGARRDRAEFIAGELRSVLDRPVVTDVADAIGNLPCVLVPPPRVLWRRLGGSSDVEWRFVILSSGPPTFSSWAELDDLLDQVAEEVPLETADPGVYPLVAGGDPIACYVATFTDTL